MSSRAFVAVCVLSSFACTSAQEPSSAQFGRPVGPGLTMSQSEIDAWVHPKKSAKLLRDAEVATTQAKQVDRSLFKEEAAAAPKKVLSAGFEKLRALKRVYDELPHPVPQADGATPNKVSEGTDDVDETVDEKWKPGLTKDFSQQAGAGVGSKVQNFLERVRQARKDRMEGKAPHVDNWEVALATIKKPLRVSELKSYQQMEKDEIALEKGEGQVLAAKQAEAHQKDRAAKAPGTVQKTPDDEVRIDPAVLAAKSKVRKDILGRTSLDDLKSQATETTERLVEKMIPVMRQGVDDYKRGIDWYSKKVDSWMRTAAGDKETKVEYSRPSSK